MTLRPIAPEGLSVLWDWVRNGLLHCINKTHARYLPEDVYVRLRAGTAWLYLIETEQPVGFVVLTQEFDPDGLVMFVWALWCRPGSMRTVHPLLYVELEKLGQAIKARRIRMQSPRKGWLSQAFFTPMVTVYEHEIGGA